MKKTKLRSLVLRECPICKSGAFVRKDAVGKLCRPCRAKENNKTRKAIDISGLVFGKLTVIKPSHQVNKLFYWECICLCGNKLITSGNRLRSGKTKSCGCIVSSRNRQSTTPAYRSWKAMNQRCYDIKSISYARYGGKGITVCDRWRLSFDNFLQDMGQRGSGWSIDRINFFGNYEPNNCRWSTAKEQNNNRSSNYIVTAFGQDHTLAEWSDITGINWSIIRQRIKRNNWTPEEALTIPINKSEKKK